MALLHLLLSLSTVIFPRVIINSGAKGSGVVLFCEGDASCQSVLLSDRLEMLLTVKAFLQCSET